MKIDLTRIPLLLLFFAFSQFVATQSYGLSGKISDAASGEPLIGATISLTGTDGVEFGVAADEFGRYQIEQIKAGRYLLQISYVGYLPVKETGYLIGTGPASGRNFALQPDPDLTITPVEVTYVRLTPVVYPIRREVKLEEVKRLPATFYDPARLLALSPGVAQTNDQANHLSVRGNSPNRNLWRLEGLAIVNPNHTANAGTIDDQPTLSGGGVNALSAQLLDNSTFYPGNLPAAYGNATGGTFDMRLRPGNTQQRQHQIQAGFIGFDLATEGPLAKGKSNSGSYLVNYRYSFTGLLADMGVDFGGEEIRFQDFSAHLYQPVGKTGKLSAFGLYGRSSNEFTGNREEPEEGKDLFDIDFQSSLLITGATYEQRIGAGKLSVGFAYSETDHDREETRFTFGQPRTSNRPLFQSRTSGRLAYSISNAAGYRFTLGNEFLNEQTDTGFRFGNGATSAYEQNITSPYVQLEKRYGKFGLSLGLRYAIYLDLNESNAVEPRFALNYFLNRSVLTLSAERTSRLPTEAAAFLSDLENENDFVPVTNQFGLGWQLALNNGDRLSANTYFQFTADDFGRSIGSFFFGGEQFIYNNEFMNLLGGSERLSATRSYGLELSYSRPIQADAWYYSGNLTLFRSEGQGPGGEWFVNRFSRDFIFQGLGGKEWSGTNKKGKRRDFGVNLSLILAGGERFYPFEFTGGAGIPFRTDFSEGRADRLPTYIRPDLRLYRRKYHKKTTTTLALDIQNLSGIENTAYRFYDGFTGEIEDQKQLGLIPVLSYRIEWR